MISYDSEGNIIIDTSNVPRDEEYGDGTVGFEESFIIAFDYDFYIIDYYLEEGAISTHDDTGMLVEEYNEYNEEDVEWFD